MNIFNRKIKKKHIEQFERMIADLLDHKFPQIKKVLGISNVCDISFMHKPDGIYVLRSHAPEADLERKCYHKNFFHLYGIAVPEKKTGELKPLKLTYSYDSLAFIEIENPEKFHRKYDLTNVRIGEVELEQMPMENPDREIAEKALKSLTREQKELLELEDAFEIEIEGKVYYTILDMEDGNYIAVDISGKIFRLNHDHAERIKKIADKPIDFVKLYNGQKSDLNQIMYE
jgi:hypothetical protein